MMGCAHRAAIPARWMTHPRHLAWFRRIVGAWIRVLATLLATGS
jgi:hypothetical protein